jgi:6-phosphogluconolactonase
MKWNKIGRAGLASVLSLGLISVAACSRDYVLAYVYVTASKPLASGSLDGGVSAYAVDYQSGALTPLADSPVPAGNTPVALVPSPNGLFLYVVNEDDSNVMVYSIGTDGKLYNQQTVNVTGSSPTSVAIDAQGKYLFVTFTYQLNPTTGQQQYSPASPGPGGITVFPIDQTKGTLGAAVANTSVGLPPGVSSMNFFPVGNNPVGVVTSKPQINTTPAGYVYVIDQETAANGGPTGVVLGFSENLSTGALTPVPGTTITTPAGGKTTATGVGAGTTPSGIAEDPSARFVYITDQASNQVYGYLAGTNGQLVPMANGPFSTGIFPSSVQVDPRGKYLYVTNLTSGTVSAYAINTSTGTPTGSVGSASVATDTNPTCVTIEPALGIYLYTSNKLASDVSGMKLDANNGGLQQVQNTPFPSAGLPTCAVAVANGSGHPTQLINP